MLRYLLALSLISSSFTANAQMANLSDNKKAIEQFLAQAREARIPAIFEGSSPRCTSFTNKYLITSYDQADHGFEIVKKLIYDNNSHAASYLLEMLILSITEGTIPYSETKFEAYKKTFLSLISLKKDPVSSLCLESDLEFTAGKIIEFISEKQHNQVAAEAYAISLIKAACNVIDGNDLLCTLFHTWCKFHKINGSFDRGIAYIAKVTRTLALTKGVQLEGFDFPSTITGLEILFDYAEDIGNEFVVSKSCEIINLLFSHTFETMKAYGLAHEKEIIDHVSMITDYYSTPDQMNKMLNDDDFTKDEKQENLDGLRLYQNALKNGIQDIIKLSKNYLAKEIVETARKTAALMDSEQALVFLQDVQTKLTERGLWDTTKELSTEE